MVNGFGQTYGFVLLRQKNALPSGIGRIFSLGGARSAIFNWTPPSEERRGEERRGEERRGEERRMIRPPLHLYIKLQHFMNMTWPVDSEPTILSFRKLLLLLVLCVFIDVHLWRQKVRLTESHSTIQMRVRPPFSPSLPLQPPSPPPLPLSSSWRNRKQAGYKKEMVKEEEQNISSRLFSLHSITHSFFLSSPSPPARLSTAMAKKTFSRMSDTLRTRNNPIQNIQNLGAAVAQRVEQVTGSNPSYMSKCPWARYWTPHCSLVRALRWAGDLSSEHPALALRQGWDWLQQQYPATPWKGISGYGYWHDMTYSKFH